ncbi:MAG: hypothetical protein ACTSVT_12050 [Candidatus Thorarchaeota archaeon]
MANIYHAPIRESRPDLMTRLSGVSAQDTDSTRCVFETIQSGQMIRMCFERDRLCSATFQKSLQMGWDELRVPQEREQLCRCHILEDPLRQVSPDHKESVRALFHVKCPCSVQGYTG